MQPALYFRRRDAAAYLRAKYGFGANKTLAKLASVGGGPRFRMVGRFPVYAPEDLDAWAMARIGEPVKSTSEARAVLTAPTRRKDRFHGPARPPGGPRRGRQPGTAQRSPHRPGTDASTRDITH
jgi:hypothetical protein